MFEGKTSPLICTYASEGEKFCSFPAFEAVKRYWQTCSCLVSQFMKLNGKLMRKKPSFTAPGFLNQHHEPVHLAVAF